MLMTTNTPPSSSREIMNDKGKSCFGSGKMPAVGLHALHGPRFVVPSGTGNFWEVVFLTGRRHNHGDNPHLQREKNNKHLSFSLKWFSLAGMKGMNRAGRCLFTRGIPEARRLASGE